MIVLPDSTRSGGPHEERYRQFKLELDAVCDKYDAELTSWYEEPVIEFGPFTDTHGVLQDGFASYYS